MTGSLNPADMRAYIVERLVGATGETGHVITTARALAERVLPGIRKGLAGSLSAPVSVEIGSVDVTRLTAARPAQEDNGAMTVVASPSSPDALVLVADSRAIAILVSALFGGDPDIPVAPIERPLSPTEIEVATMTFEEVAKAVNGSGPRAFGLKLPVPAAFAGADLDARVMRDGPAVRIDLAVAAGPSSGRISLFMPQRVLLKHRGGPVAPGQAAGSERDWGERFGEEIMRSSVTLEATMPLARMTLAEVACLRPGQVIELGDDAHHAAKLSARHKTLFVCEFGKLGQNYTVRVRQAFDVRQDLIDGLAQG
jgi:flagellar motor switch protein FliM